MTKGSDDEWRNMVDERLSFAIPTTSVSFWLEG